METCRRLLAVVALCSLSAVSAGNSLRLTVVAGKYAFPGNNVKFICIDSSNSTGVPNNFTYQWLKDNNVLPNGNKRILSIHNVSFLDEGDYNCSILEHGVVISTSAKFPFSLTVPPEVKIEQAKGEEVFQIAERSDLFLTCNLTNSPNPSIPRDGYWWSFLPMDGRCLNSMTSGADSDLNMNCTGGQEVNLSSNAVVKTAWEQEWVELSETSVKRSQSGRYTCHASNDPFISQSFPSGTAAIDVQVQYLDQSVRISPSPTQTAVTGDNVTLTCQVDSLPTATLTWLHLGRVLRTVESNEDNYIFNATGCEDSGEYQCRAHNEAVNKTVSKKTQIVVECPPTPVGSGSLPRVTQVTAGELEDLTLSINALGNPPPAYTWSGPAPMTGQGSSSVTLHRLLHVDAGNYTVNVSNVHGSFLHTFHVAVQPAAADAGFIWWPLVIGATLFAVAIIFICIFVKWRFCSRGQQNISSHNNDEHQYMVLFARDYYDSSGRRRQSEGVADYFSGESMNPYWSIGSADLPWLPQSDPSQDPPSQGSGGLNYDVPPDPVGLPLPRPHKFRHEDPYPASDVTATSDVTTSIDSDSVNEFTKGFPPGETSSTPQDGVWHCLEEGQDPEDSLSYFEWNVMGSQGAGPLYEEEDEGSEGSISYFKWNMAGSQGARPLCGEKDQLLEDSEVYCEWEVNQG